MDGEWNVLAISISSMLEDLVHQPPTPFQITKFPSFKSANFIKGQKIGKIHFVSHLSPIWFFFYFQVGTQKQTIEMHHRYYNSVQKNNVADGFIEIENSLN